jgi:hypothetical protein
LHALAKQRLDTFKVGLKIGSKQVSSTFPMWVVANVPTIPASLQLYADCTALCTQGNPPVGCIATSDPFIVTGLSPTGQYFVCMQYGSKTSAAGVSDEDTVPFAGLPRPLQYQSFDLYTQGWESIDASYLNGKKPTPWYVTTSQEPQYEALWKEPYLQYHSAQWTRQETSPACTSDLINMFTSKLRKKATSQTDGPCSANT